MCLSYQLILSYMMGYSTSYYTIISSPQVCEPVAIACLLEHAWDCDSAQNAYFDHPHRYDKYIPVSVTDKAKIQKLFEVYAGIK